jgi:hypothetical protein
MDDRTFERLTRALTLTAALALFVLAAAGAAAGRTAGVTARRQGDAPQSVGSEGRSMPSERQPRVDSPRQVDDDTR